MATQATAPGASSRVGVTPARWPGRVAVVAGSMMLGGAALNSALVVTTPGVYPALGTWFAEVSPWPLGPLAPLWSVTFGAHPRAWGTVVGIGYEATVGALALSRAPRHRLLGLGGVTAFTGGLLAMGLWWWAVPWLAVLGPTVVVTARALPRQGRAGGPSARRVRT